MAVSPVPCLLALQCCVSWGLSSGVWALADSQASAYPHTSTRHPCQTLAICTTATSLSFLFPRREDRRRKFTSAAAVKERGLSVDTPLSALQRRDLVLLRNVVTQQRAWLPPPPSTLPYPWQRAFHAGGCFPNGISQVAQREGTRMDDSLVRLFVLRPVSHAHALSLRPLANASFSLAQDSVRDMQPLCSWAVHDPGVWMGRNKL